MSADDIQDASDEVTTNNRSRDQARSSRDDADQVRKVMHTKHGRAWLYRILDGCHIFETAFFPGQTDTTAFRLGEQNMGNKLLRQIMDASGDLYVQMVTEARAEEARTANEVRTRNQEQAKQREAEQSSAGVHDLPAPEGFRK